MRLIDADVLEREEWLLCRTFQKDKNTMVYEVKKPSDFPTIEERKKGKWIKAKNWGIRCYQCDQCGNYLDFDGVNAGRGAANYCPNCGTDMREVKTMEIRKNIG